MDTVRLPFPTWHEQPLPPAGMSFTQFIFKAYSRCNLACPGCFVYEGADKDFRSQPRRMTEKVIGQSALRIAQHAETHNLEHVGIDFHGGEALLGGAQYLADIAQTCRDALPPSVTKVSFGLQTNGVLLRPNELDILKQQRIRVGVSLDGKQEDNDRQRPAHDGKGSYSYVAAALQLLQQEKYRDIYAGLLCTVNLAHDPLETYDALMAFKPPSIDFLLPHASWDEPPRRHHPNDPYDTSYADWLIPIYDRWMGRNQPLGAIPDAPATGIRLFDAITAAKMNIFTASESVGLLPMRFVVIDTDGSIRQVDSLKALYEGADQTGLNIFDDDFEMALQHPGIVARHIGRQALSETCQNCSIVKICGGGHYVHRYRRETGFANPSVYCADLRKLIDHITAYTDELSDRRL